MRSAGGSVQSVGQAFECTLEGRLLPTPLKVSLLKPSHAQLLSLTISSTCTTTG